MDDQVTIHAPPTENLQPQLESGCTSLDSEAHSGIGVARPTALGTS